MNKRFGEKSTFWNTHFSKHEGEKKSRQRCRRQKSGRFSEKRSGFSRQNGDVCHDRGEKKNKGERGHFRTRRPLARLSPSLARLRVRAPQRFSIFAFTPSPYPFKPLIDNKIRVNIAHRKAFTCLFTSVDLRSPPLFGHYRPILLKQRTLCFRRTLQNVNNHSYLIESQSVASLTFTTFTLPSPFFRP